MLHWSYTAWGYLVKKKLKKKYQQQNNIEKINKFMRMEWNKIPVFHILHNSDHITWFILFHFNKITNKFLQIVLGINGKVLVAGGSHFLLLWQKVRGCPMQVTVSSTWLCSRPTRNSWALQGEFVVPVWKHIEENGVSTDTKEQD